MPSVETKSTNILRRKLARKLLSLSRKLDLPILKRLAQEVAKPRRKRVAVNLGKINQYAEEGEIVVVPGKVLSAGSLSKSLTVVAEAFSAKALEKIRASGGRAVTLLELVSNEQVLNEFASKPKKLIK